MDKRFLTYPTAYQAGAASASIAHSDGTLAPIPAPTPPTFDGPSETIDVYKALSGVAAGQYVLKLEDADNALVNLLPRFDHVHYDLLIAGEDGIARIKAVVSSEEDMKRLMDGESVDVDWYRKEGDEWVFVERRPLRFTFRSDEG